MNYHVYGSKHLTSNVGPRLPATVRHGFIISNYCHQAAALLFHANSGTWCPDVACQCDVGQKSALANAPVFSSQHCGRIRSNSSSVQRSISTWTREAAKSSLAQRQLHIACSTPNDNHSSSNSQSTSGDSGGDRGSGSGTGGGSSSKSGDGDSSSSSRSNNLPAWYKVWMWATAVTYLVWRWKWRRDRKLAAEQFAREQQMEQQLKQEWDKFAERYGVAGPQEAGR